MNTTIPNWRERQKSLYARDRKGDPEQWSRIARACLEAGRFQEALEYAAGAKNAEILAQLERVCLDEGDAFLFTALEKLTATPRSSDLWNQLGLRAMDLGKHVFARKAFERTANEEMLAKLKSPPHGAAPDASEPGGH